MRVVDLFCGAGGFSEGFERAGFEIIKAYDIWEPAIITHNQNHGFGTNPAVRGDIYTISMLDDEEFEEAIPDSEIIIGSPPCVAFSNSNKSGKADKTLGVKLINAFLRIVARKMVKDNSELKYWVMENVVNSSKYLLDSYTAEDLEWPALGGDFVLKLNRENNIYNMKDFGVPTNRKRYVCGSFPEIYPIIKKVEVLNLGTILKVLGPPNPQGYRTNINNVSDPVYNFEIPTCDLADHHYIKEIPEFEWKKAERQKKDKGYMGQMSFPENEEKPARTIMATMSASSRESMIFKLGNEVHRYRYPTIREAATLMSFPIDFRFYGVSDSTKYRMVGNAVAPKFAYEIAKAIREDAIKNHNVVIEDRFSTTKIFDDSPNNEVNFTNLNGEIFELKIEKEKKVDAKYSYHVPYLIKNAYRVGLNNNFENGVLSWEVKIHHSQGKNAKVFGEINIPQNLFEDKPIRVGKFIELYRNKIMSYENLQRNYCMTNEQRKDLIGPDELLIAIKDFLDNFEEKYIEVKEFPKPVSSQILISFYLLKNIIEGLKK
ncbi:DNA cytosine methyltransferase [Solibacillus cecembensis]|uniref:DNA cytosine methyltransferase n=1 Tax=Solibacillus cecembensis TaxID=459347 RepID=UPI003D027D7A